METTNKEQEILTYLNKILPHVKISPLRLGTKDGVEYVKYFISPNNSDLYESEYFYKGKLRFVHFTSLNAIQSIVSERCIRLYNINNLSDPREYSYAGNLIFFNYLNKIDAKENIYILSMCEDDILTKDETEIEFNFWRLYGNNGFGVALILSFELHPPEFWKDYYLSSVQYGSKKRAKLNSFKTLHRELENEKPYTEIDLGQIVCFHKSKLYGLEQEIRLIFDNRNKNNFSSTKYLDSNNRLLSPLSRIEIAKSKQLDKKIRYLELPIFYKNFEPISDKNRIPIPQIEKIILGYQYKQITGLTEKIGSLCSERLNYIPTIEKSRLTKYYHDK